MSDATSIPGVDDPVPARAIALRPAWRVATTIGWVLAPIYLGIFGVSIVTGSIVLSCLRILWDRSHAERETPEPTRRQNGQALITSSDPRKSGGAHGGDST